MSYLFLDSAYFKLDDPLQHYYNMHLISEHVP